MTTRVISKQTEQSGDFDRLPRQKIVTKSRRKRGIDKAFPEYYESGTKPWSNNAHSV